MSKTWHKDVPARITEYLSNGGAFNPELMNHDVVRDLLVDARDVIETVAREQNKPIKTTVVKKKKKRKVIDPFKCNCTSQTPELWGTNHDHGCPMLHADF